MNPELPNHPRDEMEQRLTALLLGELSAGEAAALHRTLEQDGELAKLFARLHHTVGLVRETVASPSEPASAQAAPTKLSAARREKLLTHFKTVAPKEFTPEKRRAKFTLVELAAVLVILALLAAIMLPALSRSKSKSSRAHRADAASEAKSAPVSQSVQADEQSRFYSLNADGGVDDETKQLPSAEPQMTVPVGDAGGRELSGYNLNVSELPAASHGIDASETEEMAKRPTGITPLRSKPSAPIVLPPPVENHGYWAAGERSSGRVDDGRKENGRLTQTRGGDSEWVGELEKPTRPHSITNSFVARYAFIANTPPAEGDDSFRHALDLNRNAAIDPGTGLAVVPSPKEVPPAQTEAIAFQSAGGVALNYGSVSGGGSGGGGGAGGGGSSKDRAIIVRDSAELEAANEVLALKPPEVNLKAKFAEIAQNDSRALGFDWYAGKKLAQVESEFGRFGTAQDGQPAPDVLADGTVTTISGRSSSVGVDKVPVLQDLPVLGRLSASSDQNGVAPTGPAVPDGGRIAPEPNVSSLDVVGYTAVPIQYAHPEEIASSLSVLRQGTSIVLPGVVASAAPRQPQSALGENEPVADSRPAAGKRSREVLLAKAEDADRQLRDSSAELEKNRPYVEKKRELQELLDFRRLLTRKMNVEKIDLSLPKSAQVEIVENAVAEPAPSQSGWRKLLGVGGGEVEGVARIKVERDKSDIDEISGATTRFNPYDPNFVQTEPETIQSEAVLGKVVERLKLDETWAKKKGAGTKLPKAEAVAMLRGRLNLRTVPNTTLMEIGAKSAKPEEAAQIANAVAQAYKEWRLERGQRLVTAGITELEKQSRQHEERIGKVKAELEQLREGLKISDADAAAEIASATMRKPATNAPIPQPEIQTSENNFSTFSLNVSDVSFKLAAASLEKGQMPDAASVRSEEFINAFDYRDPEPAAGAPIAFAYERARYPFAHNRDLLRFSLKTAAAGRQAGRPLNIVLLLDNSGSMERADRVRIIREALRVLAGQLQSQDKLSVITFARTARLVVDGASGNEAEAVALAVSEITPQGGTNLEDAMKLAYQTAAKHYLANGINRVVLLTDGAANLGDVEPDSLKQKVEAQRQQGIALDCFGIGWEGLNDDLLEVLSRNGDGRYGFINSPEEAATDFVGQLAGALKVAASDVKVQVEFNPKRVTAYRQIGYAKHQLTKEQFRDNTVDAAEIAAQEAGNALYTVEVNPAGVGPLCTVRVRYKIPGTTTYLEQAWDVPYTGNALSLEQATPAMRLAASASAFAEWLVASPFAGEVTPDTLLGYLGSAPDVYGADARPKKLEWMIRQAKSLEGK